MHDADGQQLAYVYYESELGRRSAAKLLSKDEARRVAVAELLRFTGRNGRKPDILKAPMERIVKQLLIALFTFAALITSANAHGLKNHVCHKHGTYGYHCHP